MWVRSEVGSMVLLSQHVKRTRGTGGENVRMSVVCRPPCALVISMLEPLRRRRAVKTYRRASARMKITRFGRQQHRNVMMQCMAADIASNRPCGLHQCSHSQSSSHCSELIWMCARTRAGRRASLCTDLAPCHPRSRKLCGCLIPGWRQMHTRRRAACSLDV